jgi:hypothetical protein
LLTWRRDIGIENTREKYEIHVSPSIHVLLTLHSLTRTKALALLLATSFKLL